jgi:hypothetical protein
MKKINTGILFNVSPLTTEQIKELEDKVLKDGISYAYLNENSQLCFALPNNDIEGIKELAWSNAYELTKKNQYTFCKKAYKKTGLKTFELEGEYIKDSYTDKGWMYVFDGVYYALKDDNTFEVCSWDYEIMPKDLVIQAYIQDRPVTSISDSVFAEGGNSLTSVTIPGTVKTIGSEAFRHTDLRKVTLSEGLESISWYAFGGCS